MSAFWWDDVRLIHDKMGHSPVFQGMDSNKLNELFKLRLVMIKEEVKELEEADTPDKVVDAVIDMIVFGIGTLDAFGVDLQVAWDEVLRANLQKRPGVKPGRPNPMGLPDLIKPEGWCEPSHQFNIGRLNEICFDELKGADSLKGEMMPPKFALCPECSSPLNKKKVEESRAGGRKIKCPNCSKEV